ncbi:hypothetical protein HNR23_004132 [Nocardiopsis mwathae]|uniref:Uncharacterized protein n=1 Tax=Nocardiopsis mwathae TaxID=1472723 RepID=A0A7W9YKX7_9ACTN|nr:hypothetical protein [Nocardiopsis mwathae]
MADGEGVMTATGQGGEGEGGTGRCSSAMIMGWHPVVSVSPDWIP